MSVHFVSDTHFGHANIIQYSSRPYRDVNHMNTSLVSNWNSVVQPTDDVYHLGDVCMGNLNESVEWIWKLNGNIHLIRGNHDSKSVKNDRFVSRFEWIKDYHEMKIKHDGKEYKIILFHFPIASWHHAYRGAFHVHGHCHSTYKPGRPSTLDQGKILDVGVDCHNYTPVSLPQVIKIMERKIFKKVDDHEIRDTEGEKTYG